MSVSVDLSLSGHQEVQAALARLSGPQAKQVIRQSSREALRPLLTTIKANCPVRSGKMRQSIKIRSLKRSRKMIGATITVGDKEKAYVGKQFYASFIVFGWKAGSRKRTREVQGTRQGREAKIKERRQIPPNKFMQDAVKKHEESVRKDYYMQIGKRIEALAK